MQRQIQFCFLTFFSSISYHARFLLVSPVLAFYDVTREEWVRALKSLNVVKLRCISSCSFLIRYYFLIEYVVVKCTSIPILRMEHVDPIPIGPQEKARSYTHWET